MTPASLVIVGSGLIGTSVALAARRAWPEIAVASLDRGDALDAVRGADVVILSTPVDVILDLLGHHAAAFGKALVIDTGSTKRAIVQAARAAGLDHFVGGHPMAGAASPGPDAARADLFDGRPWFLVHPEPAPGVLARAVAFVDGLGARAVVMRDDGGAHDRLMAGVSHAPQVVASALMKVVGDAAGVEGLRWAGAGLRDTTRLAASPASMWESVLATNKGEVAPMLDHLGHELIALARRLDDGAAVRAIFDAANAYRRALEKGTVPFS